MNKIEEILQSKRISPATKCHNYEYLYKAIQESMIEFGRLAFEAGQKQHWEDCPFNDGNFEFTYYCYEDFLKEIENDPE